MVIYRDLEPIVTAPPVALGFRQLVSFGWAKGILVDVRMIGTFPYETVPEEGNLNVDASDQFYGEAAEIDRSVTTKKCYPVWLKKLRREVSLLQATHEKDVRHHERSVLHVHKPTFDVPASISVRPKGISIGDSWGSFWAEQKKSSSSDSAATARAGKGNRRDQSTEQTDKATAAPSALGELTWRVRCTRHQ